MGDAMANGCPALLSALQQPTFAGAAVFDWLLAIVAASPVLLATLLAALCHRRSAPAPPACLIVARVLSIALLAVGAIGVLAHGIPRTVLTCLVASELGAVGLVLSEAGYWSLRFRQLTERNGLLPHLPPWLRELLTRTTWLEFLTAPGLAEQLVLWTKILTPFFLGLDEAEVTDVLAALPRGTRDAMLQRGLLPSLPVPLQRMLLPPSAPTPAQPRYSSSGDLVCAARGEPVAEEADFAPRAVGAAAAGSVGEGAAWAERTTAVEMGGYHADEDETQACAASVRNVPGFDVDVMPPATVARAVRRLAARRRAATAKLVAEQRVAKSVSNALNVVVRARWSVALRAFAFAIPSSRTRQLAVGSSALLTLQLLLSRRSRQHVTAVTRSSAVWASTLASVVAVSWAGWQGQLAQGSGARRREPPRWSSERKRAAAAALFAILALYQLRRMR